MSNCQVDRQEDATKLEKRGDCAVALLDVLGAATNDIEVTEKIQNQVNALRKIMARMGNQIHQGAKETEVGDFYEPQFMIFGDTVLFLWQLDKQAEQTKYLPVFGLALGHVFVEALQQGIPLRGALAFGYAAYDDQVAVGPAVSDAAAWYEQADALAVLVTPRTGLVVEMYSHQDPRLIGEAFAKFNFKLKDSTTRQELWAVSWPAVLRDRCRGDGISEEDIRPRLLSTLHQKFVIPKGTEMKYHEALSFYDHCAQQWSAQ